LRGLEIHDIALQTTMMTNSSENVWTEAASGYATARRPIIFTIEVP
jgi:hypothetical protein